MSYFHRKFSSFLILVPNKKYSSPYSALNFHINIGIHMRKMSQKLVYYYLYNKET